MSDTSCKQPKTMSSITIVKYRLMDEHGIPKGKEPIPLPHSLLIGPQHMLPPARAETSMISVDSGR